MLATHGYRGGSESPVLVNTYGLCARNYLNYNAVLVRLSRVTPDVLRDLLGMAHKLVTADAARRSPTRHRREPA
jgi:hypothetical protein